MSRRAAFILGSTAALLYLATALSACLIENAVLYKPRRDNPDPNSYGLPAEPLRLQTEDGKDLGAWWVPTEAPDAPALLMFQGRRGLRNRYLYNLKGLHEAGFALLLFHYRGFGDSSGVPYEGGLIADGLTAFDWLTTHQPQRPVILFGRSLGGGVAAQVALRRPAAGLVLESTFTNVPDMARTFVDVPGVEWLVYTDFDTLEAVRELRMPLLVIHGTADSLIPFEMGQTLFESAVSPHKVFRQVPYGSHWNTYNSAGRDYYAWFQDFGRRVREALAQDVPPPGTTRPHL